MGTGPTEVDEVSRSQPASVSWLHSFHNVSVPLSSAVIQQLGTCQCSRAWNRNIITCKSPSSAAFMLSLQSRWEVRQKQWLHLAESAFRAAASWDSSWALKQKADRKALDTADLWEVKGRLDTGKHKRSHERHKKNWHKIIMCDLCDVGSDRSWPDLASTGWTGPNLLYQIIRLCIDMA